MTETPTFPGSLAEAKIPQLLHDTVVAEDAPLGVLLWPVRAERYAPNFTLARVAVIREEHGSFVEWTYQSGTIRTFAVGERIVVRL